MITMSKHFGIQKEVYDSFEKAWKHVKSVVEVDALFHATAQDAFNTAKKETLAFTNHWIVGRIANQDAHVGPIMVYEIEYNA